MESRNSKSLNPYHPDVLLFLILIPFISAINYYLTYNNIRLSYFLFLTFTIDTVQGYIAWWAVRHFIFFLDGKWSYEKGGVKRIIVQVLATMLIGLTIISLLTEMASFIAKGKPAPIDFYTIDLFIIGIWFFFINGVYIGLYYYNLWKSSEEQRRQESRLKTDGLLVRSGKQEIKLSYDELIGFTVDDSYVIANHVSGKKHYLDQSLDKLEKVLPEKEFFRLNRKVIAHRQIIEGFKRADNGKIIVMLNKPDVFPHEIPVSRLKAPAFKTWFRPDA
jgi:hypothetical protein